MQKISYCQWYFFLTVSCFARIVGSKFKHSKQLINDTDETIEINSLHFIYIPQVGIFFSYQHVHQIQLRNEKSFFHQTALLLPALSASVVFT